MRASPSRCSILIVAAVLVLAVACSSDTTTTADGSTTSVASSTPATGAPGTAGPDTTETGVTRPSTVDSSDPGGGGPDTTEGSTTTTGGGGPDPSVPIVDAASVEAFCALNTQLEDLADNQLDVGDVSDPEVLRTKMAAFLTDNAAVIDQYIAAAPPEIEDDVEASMGQTRAAVDDPKLFAELMSGNADTASSERVSDFVDANCPDT